MNLKSLKTESSLPIVGRIGSVSIAILLILLLVTTPSCSNPINITEDLLGTTQSSYKSDSKTENLLVATQSGSNADSINEDLADAFKLSNELLAKRDFESAYDMLLVTSRLAPSDPKVLDLISKFVEDSFASGSDDAVSLAEDLLDVGDSLVLFQRPRNVDTSRKQLSELRKKFIKSEPVFEPDQPLDAVMQLIFAGNDDKNEISTRTRAIEQARLILNDLQLQIAIGVQLETKELNRSVLRDIYKQIDSIEQRCIESLFGELQSRINDWTSAGKILIEEAEISTIGEEPEMGQKLKDMADSGFDLLQELVPYMKSSIAAANDQFNIVEKLVEDLRRQKIWLYNKASLAMIRTVESGTGTPQEKIRWLSEIREEQLSPYVLRRHNELWDKVFYTLPNEGTKVEAVRLRILRIYQ